MAELVVGEGQKYPLRADGSIVGRRSDDGIFYPDVDLGSLEGGRSVSRHHARIYKRDGQWYIRVEPTVTNVTAVAGQPVSAGQEAPLHDGDELLFGRVAVIFRAGEEEPATPPEPAIPELEQPSAELRCEGQVFALRGHEGTELTVGRHSEDRSHVPDIDLGNVPYGRTVSRRHGRLLRRDGKWHLRVEAEVTNPTLLNGTQLALGQEVPLSDGQTLQLGRVILTFHQVEQIPTASEDQIEVNVDQTSLVVDAGGTVWTELTVINHTGHVDWFRIEIVGLPETWYQITAPDGVNAPTAQVRLFHTPFRSTPIPDSITRLRLTIRPPKTCESRAGVHQFAVTATTLGEPQLRRVAPCNLTIRPFESLQAEIRPEQVRATRAEFHIDLHNAGNANAVVALDATAKGLKYQWAQSELTLAPCARERAKLNVRVEKRHWLGMDRTYTFAVGIKSGEQQENLRAQLLCPPIVPIWIQTFYQRIHAAIAPFLGLIAIVVLFLIFVRPPEIKEFKADQPSVIVGTPVTLSWELTGRVGSVTLEPSSGSEELPIPKGEIQVNPDAQTKYTLTARNVVGIIPSSRSVDVEVLPAPELPRIISFTASPERIRKEGEAVTLRWEVEGATSVTIEPADEIENPPLTGEAIVHPQGNNVTYKLVATNEAGSRELSKTIVVDPPQVLSFTANPESVIQGGEVRLRWTAQGFTKLIVKASTGEIAEGQQEVEVSPEATELVVRPLEETEYTLTATNAAGSEAKTVKVTVSPMQITFFRAEPARIPKGQTTTLSWNVIGATSIAIEPGIGTVAPGETQRVVNPEETTEYTLTATGAGGQQVQQKTTVTVTAGPVKIDFFTAAPPAIDQGGQATLTFSVQNAKTITIRGSDGSTFNVPPGDPVTTGSINVQPATTTTYTLTAGNDDGQSAAPATVEVRPPPTPAPPPPAQPEPPPPSG